ncbi:uncharacterized protein Z520_11947 [Fonsecaea multimorphosa CBS 102226]|uniref:DUF4396 domain-containing protein n=1 Tax=Fonsecaea multimorphosa CBS 102226 TaxID=1442371 RepID=A0A0D2JPE7_9EURO|nr:uncharacterized protein Z520_11947 [Fonsecaea multimorphosa CBS 102226]KIX92339.1 hypothetical protein Z520_11947 [Fonsecaea multimorphosa CBS 102226]OAL17713.1 hypothetical protein AYO22_11369 [Fonsecaea multimorphosa]
MAPDSYHQPVSLIVLSSISIGVAALAALWILVDIVHRRGWKSMMLIMIPVYTINALYIWPITVGVYLKYGRAAQPRHERSASDSSTLNESLTPQPGRNPSDGTREMKKEESAKDDPDHGERCHHSGERPIFATATIAVCLCGAACVLGDIVGEWLVYGTEARIGAPGRLLWTEFLVKENR